MKKANSFMVIFVLTCFNYSCYYSNPVERNHVVFKDQIKNVQDSLIKMRALLKKLPIDIKGLNTRYFFENEVLFINSEPCGKIDSFKIDTVKVLSKFSNNEKMQFLILAKYLQRNYITCGYFDLSANLWLFEYRVLPDNTFNDSRSITILSDKEDQLLEPFFRILDRKNMVCLIVSKEAKIR